MAIKTFCKIIVIHSNRDSLYIVHIPQEPTSSKQVVINEGKNPPSSTLVKITLSKSIKNQGVIFRLLHQNLGAWWISKNVKLA